MLQLKADALAPSKLHTLVENRTTYTLESAALNLFETHERATAVELRFDQPVLASMIQGRKVMHLREKRGFNFLPGESVMLPARELMRIDFPDARADRATKCLALEISPDLIARVLQRMNEVRPHSVGDGWRPAKNNFHFAHDPGINQLIQRIVYLCAEDHPNKDLFVDMSLSELLIRLLELESRHDHVRNLGGRSSSHPITAAVEYILTHLNERLTVDELSRLACMSTSSFYRSFRNEMGISPVDFINGERLKQAVSLLRQGRLTIRQIALRCGFNSASYFTRTFKKQFGMSPAAWQKRQRPQG